MRQAVLFFTQFWLAGFAFAQNTPSFPGAFRYQAINIPNLSSHFTPTGINDRGDVVGTYVDSSNATHGLLREASGTATLIDVPGSFATFPTAINNSGQIVGMSYATSGSNPRGFLRQPSGTIVPKDIPGATSVTLNSINNQGRIVGSYDSHAVIFEPDGTFNFFDVNRPNTSTPAATTAYGINDSGVIVGTWFVFISGGTQFYGCFQRDAAGAVTYPASCTAEFGITNAGLQIAHDSNRPGNAFGAYLRDANDRRVYPAFPSDANDTPTQGSIRAVNQLNGIAGTGPSGLPFTATPCQATITPTSQTISAAGGNVTVQVTTDTACTWGAALPVQFNRFGIIVTPYGNGSGTFAFQVPVYTGSSTPRSEVLSIAGTTFTLTQSGADCIATFSASGTAINSAGGTSSASVTAPEGCAWTATTDSPWIVLTKASGTGNDNIAFNVATNASPTARTAALTLPTGTFFINQAASQCTFLVNPGNTAFSTTGGTLNVTVTAAAGCGWFASSNASWITISGGSPIFTTGSLTFSYTIATNVGGAARTAVLNIAGTNITVTQAGDVVSGLGFIPITPCRLVDTRPGGGKTGAFGPPSLPPESTREIPVPTGTCNIPTTARAYSINVTVAPIGPLSFLTMYPTGQSRPNVSTLNAFQGQTIANAAIVPAGLNGSLSVFVTNFTDLIIDINGYFTDPAAPGTLVFYPLNPCRVIDTRVGSGGPAGAFGPPSLIAGQERSFPIRSSACSIPATAGAYVFNITLVPNQPLFYITAWPTGQSRPNASVQNSPQGRVLANAAIVPAGTNGDISLFTPEPTDVVVDINGYFAPPGQPGGLKFYPVNPCRLADTRGDSGFTGNQGPPAVVERTTRLFPVTGLCNVSNAAKAFSLNLTVVPPGYLGYVTLYPGPQLPFASTLNAWEGQVAANAAIVPAEAGGGINAYVSNTTQIILDINGYFAP